MVQIKVAHLPHVCSSADGLIVQDFWCCKGDTQTRSVVKHDAQTVKETGGSGFLKR